MVRRPRVCPTRPSRPTWRSLASRCGGRGRGRSPGSGPGPPQPAVPRAAAGRRRRGRRPRRPARRCAVAPGGRRPGRRRPRPWWPSCVARPGLAPGAAGLIVAGAGCGDPDAVLALADALGWPVLADPRSGLRGPGRPGWWRRPTASCGRRGSPPATGPTSCWPGGAVGVQGGDHASWPARRRVVVDPVRRWPDPERSADRLVRCRPDRCCAGRCRGGRPPAVGRRPGPADARLVGGWRRAERAAPPGRRRDDLGSAGAGGWTEPALAHRLVGRAARPVAAWWCRRRCRCATSRRSAHPRAGPPRVLANRGANGIDGVVSTALGVALAGGPDGGPGRATWPSCTTCRRWSARRPSGRPLTVVVADNGGGGIFSFLPQAAGSTPARFERLFGTPQAADVGRGGRRASAGRSTRSVAVRTRRPGRRRSGGRAGPGRPDRRAWSACPTGRPTWPPTTGSTPPSWPPSTAERRSARPRGASIRLATLAP